MQRSTEKATQKLKYRVLSGEQVSEGIVQSNKNMVLLKRYSQSMS